MKLPRLANLFRNAHKFLRLPIIGLGILIGVSSCGLPDDQDTDSHPRSYKAFQSQEDLSDTYSDGATMLDGVPEKSRYLSYKSGYESLWKSIAIRPDKLKLLDTAVDKINANKSRYLTIEKALGVPWYWVAIIHTLEASNNFKTHLHNGDSLNRRTVQVPVGRPKIGRPPFVWEVSAQDAIVGDGYHTWEDWDDISILAYSFERFNGFGYRFYQVNSPYLWSFSYHFTKGKFVADGVFDYDAPSLQPGAMALLKRGIDRGLWSLGKTDTKNIVSSTDKPALVRTLRYGVSTGTDILLLQMRLMSYGFYRGAFNARFDTPTEDAVSRYQKSLNLIADGEVGPATWATLWPLQASATSLRSYKKGSKVSLGGFIGNRCLYKSETNEVPMLTSFLQASLGATTITHGGDADKVTDRPTACPDSKEKYDLARRLVLSPNATTKSTAKPTEVTWHKLFRGKGQEWLLLSSAADKFITSFTSKSKTDVLSYLKKHEGAHVIYAAPNSEEPVRN